MTNIFCLLNFRQKFFEILREKRVTTFDVVLFLLIAYSICKFFYYCLRIAYHLFIFISRYFGSEGEEFILHSPLLALITLSALLFWIIFFVIFSSLLSKCSNLNYESSKVLFALFGCIGLGVLLLLFLKLLLKSSDVRLELIYLPLFSLIPLMLLSGGRKNIHAIVSYPKFSWKFTRRPLFENLVILVLFFSIASDIVFLAFMRPEATGDEAYFWYSSIESLSSGGMNNYFERFSPSNYLPGYTFIGVFITKIFPGISFEALGRAIPAFYGLMAAWLLFGRLVYGGRGYRLFGLYALFFLILIFDQPWIHDLSFRLWYGDLLPFLLLTLTFIVIDSSGSGSRIKADSIFLLIGLGALMVISKPPVSTLFLPAILPAIWISSIFLNSNNRSRVNLTICIAFLAIGAFFMKYIWAVILDQYGLQEFYSVSSVSFTNIQFNNAIKYLLNTLYDDYKTIWIFYFSTLTLALSYDAKRYTPYAIASFGVIISIILLYMGPWRDVESGSGVRYILHGAYAGTFFFLYALFEPILISYQKLKIYFNPCLIS